ncbi:MAG: DUF3034 family protein [Candidatus Omnitrophica bacterium]|nr:DUF3034 family protein [Candidatus Omnitrophota bacterium]
MKLIKLVLGIAVLTITLSSGIARAGVPFTNIEGVGGVALNPLAYPASDSSGTGTQVFSKPRFGIWYVNLNDVKTDWTSIGIADTFFNRLEVSYSYETIAVSGFPENLHKNNLGAKLLLVPENAGGHNFIPAVSVGGIWKNTSDLPAGWGFDDNGTDAYLVVTKLITQLPKPVLISGGILQTSGLATGVFGYDNESDTVFFGNVDVIVTNNLVLGVEYKEGAKFKDWKNADYWNAHLAYLANKNLSLIAAYLNAGDEKSTSKFGLGEGFVLSAQYSF